MTGTKTSSSTRPLDIIFFFGLGILAILIIWFLVHFGVKIYALVSQNSECSTGTKKWRIFRGWRKAKKVTMPQVETVSNTHQIFCLKFFFLEKK